MAVIPAGTLWVNEHGALVGRMYTYRGTVGGQMHAAGQPVIFHKWPAAPEEPGGQPNPWPDPWLKLLDVRQVPAGWQCGNWPYGVPEEWRIPVSGIRGPVHDQRLDLYWQMDLFTFDPSDGFPQVYDPSRPEMTGSQGSFGGGVVQPDGGMTWNLDYCYLWVPPRRPSWVDPATQRTTAPLWIATYTMVYDPLITQDFWDQAWFQYADDCFFHAWGFKGRANLYQIGYEDLWGVRRWQSSDMQRAMAWQRACNYSRYA